jgi:small subunit ribosomal protein S6
LIFVSVYDIKIYSLPLYFGRGDDILFSVNSEKGEITQKETRYMNFYENILILNPNLDDKAIEDAVSKVKNVVTKNGGEILKSENWGRKKLAYDLKKQSKGSYILLVFKAPPPVIAELERFYKVFDSLLKFLVVKLKKKQIAALLSSLAKEDEKTAAVTPAQETPEKT